MRDRLLAELLEFTPHDDAERRHHVDIIDLLANERFASRANYQPGHLTASAFIVDLTQERILLHHHRRLDRWLQMGGHLEPGETPAEAALREAREESGLTDLRFVRSEPFDLDVHLIPESHEPAHRHFDIRFVVATDRPEEIVMEQGESLSLRWFDFDEGARVMDEACSRRALAKIRRL